MAYLPSSTPQDGRHMQTMCATCQHNGAETIQRHLTYSRAVPADYTETGSSGNGESGNKAGKQATSPTCTRQPTDEERGSQTQMPQPSCTTCTQPSSPDHHRSGPSRTDSTLQPANNMDWGYTSSLAYFNKRYLLNTHSYTCFMSHIYE
ncbi:Hypothetical predicted protein [Pelobates cultripes]|uniref:Uncharacterized protein n=1 Tax=Pelobates cultripes TaxID=61616 RepID=A0AAD1TDF6_PELCU|nr:Hypothetical predicted protein [Pelobates cultripes]